MTPCKHGTTDPACLACIREFWKAEDAKTKPK